ncbi:MAG: response regulator transcription factor [Hyphomicrobiales bacterium]|nr:response regulator transcription factor [Hyphomicrobiales bacterium]
MSAAPKIRILIAEDQQLIRRAFKTMLSLEPDIDVVAEAPDGHEAVRLARIVHPDVVLMDLNMPRLGGVAATRQILADRPQTRVVVLTTFDEDSLVFDAISAGAAAYLLKDAEEREILATIRGQARLSPSIAEKVLGELRRTRPLQSPTGSDGPDEPLTEREHEILSLVANGKSNKEIAGALHLAEGTVKNYVSRLMEKLGVRSRTELAVKVVKSGKK